jgi:hypothetical protein
VDQQTRERHQRRNNKKRDWVAQTYVTQRGASQEDRAQFIARELDRAMINPTDEESADNLAFGQKHAWTDEMMEHYPPCGADVLRVTEMTRAMLAASDPKASRLARALAMRKVKKALR